MFGAANACNRNRIREARSKLYKAHNVALSFYTYEQMDARIGMCASMLENHAGKNKMPKTAIIDYNGAIVIDRRNVYVRMHTLCRCRLHFRIDCVQSFTRRFPRPTVFVSHEVAHSLNILSHLKIGKVHRMCAAHFLVQLESQSD